MKICQSYFSSIVHSTWYLNPAALFLHIFRIPMCLCPTIFGHNHCLYSLLFHMAKKSKMWQKKWKINMMQEMGEKLNKISSNCEEWWAGVFLLQFSLCLPQKRATFVFIFGSTDIIFLILWSVLFCDISNSM